MAMNRVEVFTAGEVLMCALDCRPAVKHRQNRLCLNEMTAVYEQKGNEIDGEGLYPRSLSIPEFTGMIISNGC
jgi:hypothetical protein